MSKRIADLEFRWTQSLGRDGERYPEIVRWYNRAEGDSFCCTVLYWVRDSEGWDIKFVGDRPFDSELDQDLLWALMRYGQSLASAEYKLALYITDSQIWTQS